MKRNPSTSQLAAVDQLKHDWPHISDLDRAKAVADLRRSGLSIRYIARRIERSASLLSHLLRALLAPAADLALALQGKLTTNELVRRAEAYASRRQAERRETAQVERAEAARRGADAICEWLSKERVYGPDGVQIIEDIRHDFADMELTGRIPSVARPGNDVSQAEIIKRCRPEEPVNENINLVAWHTRWLGRWTFFAFPDTTVRDKALDLALERQWKR